MGAYHCCHSFAAQHDARTIFLAALSHETIVYLSGLAVSFFAVQYGHGKANGVMRMIRLKHFLGWRIAVLALILSLGWPRPGAAVEPAIDLAILATTDLHMYLKDYDYYGDKPDSAVGLVRLAPMIQALRAERPNVVLVDNGDLIQGNPMGDWAARIRKKGPDETPHPAIEAMNALGYDAATVGNHEFNYGLEALADAYAGARFPVLAGNVFKVDGNDDPTDDQTLYPPYALLRRSLTDAAGRRQEVVIGIMGLLPPQIMTWDKDKLEGKLTVRDIVDMARLYAAKMKTQGADVIVAVVHSGLSAAPRQGGDENAAAYLADIPEIDAIVSGHSHRVFPGPDYQGFPGADMVRGTIKGKPVTMAGSFGSHLGTIALRLVPREATGGQASAGWRVLEGTARALPLQAPAADPALAARLEPAHQGTLRYVRRATGHAEERLHSYFSFLEDTAPLQIVADAQRAQVARALAGGPYAGLPILSAAAPFKSGGRPGVGYYTDIPAGPLALRNVADLYVYPNALAAVRLSGRQVKDWLDTASRALAVIDPAKQESQMAVDRRTPSFNFDVMDGLSYVIDLTQPYRLDRYGREANPRSSRISDVRFQGRPIGDDEMFIVATNAYRANGGGGFPHLDGTTIVYQSQEAVQTVIADYIAAKGHVDARTDATFRLKPPPAGVRLVYDCSPLARPLAEARQGLIYQGMNADGFALFALDLAAWQKDARPGRP
jgi:2',3'-cyclic-nucleotide 2'-phosphodiesterase / 3'-nucleotidase